MENRAHAIAAGIFVLLLGAAAALGIWWFGERDLPRADYLVVTRGNVTGLSPQGNVRYRGIQVGKVKDIRLSEQDPGEILIHIRVLKDVPITQKTRAQLAYQGVTGIAHILLVDDGNASPPLVATDGLPRIPMEASFFDKLGDAGGNVIQQSGELLVRAQKLLDEENQRTVRGILVNLEKLSGQLLDIGQRSVPLMNRVDAVLVETEALLNELNRGRLVRSLDAFEGASNSASAVFARWQRLADDYAALAKRLDETATRAAGQQGIGGAAARVQQLSGELEQTSRRLSRILDDLEDTPNSLLVGAPITPPGPGEAGYRAPPVQGR
jgi:phospholipid/cholesterol/gamma-HCH transport system substrate-binding protein